MEQYLLREAIDKLRASSYITPPSVPQIYHTPAVQLNLYSLQSALQRRDVVPAHSPFRPHILQRLPDIPIHVLSVPGTQVRVGERNPPHIYYLQPVANLRRQLAHILPVVCGQQHRLDARRQRAN